MSKTIEAAGKSDMGELPSGPARPLERQPRPTWDEVAKNAPTLVKLIRVEATTKKRREKNANKAISAAIVTDSGWKASVTHKQALEQNSPYVSVGLLMRNDGTGKADIWWVAKQ